MKVLAVAAVLVARGATAAAPAASLGQVVREIQAADYRGERAELQRLAASLDRVKDPKLAAYRHYWQGFARWRRALNGFNETPTPGDLGDDLTAGIASFQRALVEKPDWIEARIGIMGCAAPLFFLARDDAARRDALLKEYLPIAAAVREKGADNPRALFLMGQTQLGAPPPYGGDPVKAAATFRRGIEAALTEARQTAEDEPAWIPRWGGAENLMNLAYLYVHSPLANRELALAYGEGALVAAPEWHYMRDVLWPQILALPQPSEFRPEDVIAVERAALDRWGHGDPQGFLETYAPEVTYFDPTRDARVDGIDAMRQLVAPVAGKIKIDRYEMVNPSVQHHGDVAILAYNLVNYVKQPDGSEKIGTKWNSTTVFRRMDGRWRTIHSHWSLTKPELKEAATQ